VKKWNNLRTVYLWQRKRKSKPSGSEVPDMDDAAVTDVLMD